MERKEGISQTCRLLGVGRQVYYRCVRRLAERQKVADRVVALARGVRMDMPRLGARKLYHVLREDLRPLGVGRDRLFAILKANGMLIAPRKSYHVTTDSHHRFRKHKNLVEHLEIDHPEQVWVSDITYVGTRENPMYLSLVTDAYSKKIVGHDLSSSLSASGAVSAMKMALAGRSYPGRSLIHHSDRGLQYCCDAYQALLEAEGVRCSMTERYDPYQNAVAERVNGILKQEFIGGLRLADLGQMEKIIAESVRVYNHKRPHTSCWMNTPSETHKQSKMKIKTYKKEKILQGLNPEG